MLLSAMLALSAATVILPEDSRARYDLAALLFKEGRFEQARSHAEAAISLAPHDERAKELLAKIRARAPDTVVSSTSGTDPTSVEDVIAAAYKAVLGRPPNAKRMEASARLFVGTPFAESLERLLIALLHSKEFRDKHYPGAASGGAKPAAMAMDAAHRPDA